MNSFDQPTHAEVAKKLVASLPPGVFGHAAAAAAQHNDFTLLERMLPGVAFSVLATGSDLWELTGACADGSIIAWQLGG